MKPPTPQTLNPKTLNP